MYNEQSPAPEDRARPRNINQSEYTAAADDCQVSDLDEWEANQRIRAAVARGTRSQPGSLSALREPPGVYLYYDKFDPTRERLTNEELGKLINAVFAHAHQFAAGETAAPMIDDPKVELAFELIRPGIESSVHDQLVQKLAQSYKGFLSRRDRQSVKPTLLEWLRENHFRMDELNDKDLEKLSKIGNRQSETT